MLAVMMRVTSWRSSFSCVSGRLDRTSLYLRFVRCSVDSGRSVNRTQVNCLVKDATQLYQRPSTSKAVWRPRPRARAPTKIHAAARPDRRRRRGAGRPVARPPSSTRRIRSDNWEGKRSGGEQKMYQLDSELKDIGSALQAAAGIRLDREAFCELLDLVTDVTHLGLRDAVSHRSAGR